jgi:hypothetical protein
MKKIILTENQYRLLLENINTYTLYHGSRSNSLELTNQKIWLCESEEYAKIWGDNIFKIEITLNNILDTYNDLGNKSISLKRIFKYLKSKNVDTSDFEHITRYNDADEKYSFWELISNHKTINYYGVAQDIFSSGYDAISLFEYGYSRSQKSKTFLVNKPKDKIISIENITNEKNNSHRESI